MSKVASRGISALVVLFALNWISVFWLQYPFVYCWDQWPIMHIIAPYYYGVWITALAYFVYCLLRYGMNIPTFQAFGIMFVIVALPQWAQTIWSLGKSCQ